MISLVLLSGCVSSAIDTPQGLVGTGPLPTTSEVLALENAGGLPTPAARPGTTQTASLPVETVSEQTPVATPPTPMVAQIEEPAEPSDVNTRIASAEDAPVAGDVMVASAPVKTVTPPPPQIVAASKADTNSGGFLNSLFGKNTNRKSPPAAIKNVNPPRVVVATASASGSAAALPGVSRERALGVQSTSATLKPIQVASAAGLARLTPNGLKTQHSGVDVKCLKPALVRVLKTIEKRYGKAVVVTSGYRSATRNASIRGAKNSLHIYCSAADIQVDGVDKWTLAKYVRSMPGRGGVGTYCHTKSVHIDIGPKRDWNWRCRRR